jgi:diguanylate cyclase (GGDEF)-like protein/PAS domain S-box-containing protein
MASAEGLRILLVEDDEDDFVLTRGMLEAPGRARVELDWAQNYASALRAIRAGIHDLYLVDYRLGEHTGLELVREAWQSDPPAPVIVLTGQDDYEVDLEANELGVADFLVKGTIDAHGLERTIRYALRQHQAMADLRRSEERYAVAVRATNDAIWDWDLTTSRMHFSERWKTLLGYEDFTWDSPEGWFALVHPDDVKRLRREMDEHLSGSSPHFENEHRIRHTDGCWRWVLTRGLTSRDADGIPIRITGSLSDITERRKAQDDLVHDALHDALSGLPNRTLFMDRLAQCLSHRARGGASDCAVLYIGLDRFKLVNDSLNHTVGDRLLVELAHRLEQALRPGDTVACLGGDEFVILLDGISGSAEALNIAKRVGLTIAEPFSFELRQLMTVASIGLAHNLDGVADPEELVRNADIAMYHAKRHGGGRCEIFDAGMHQRVLDRVSVEAQLRQAIDEQTLRTFFQPIVDLRTGALHGFEALARWPAGEREVSPGEFIPVAEEAGLISPLGELMLGRACQTLSEWRRQRLVEPGVTVSVNVSICQITDGKLVESVRTALGEAELPATNLVLEITESTLIENTTLVSTVLRELMDLGVSIQLDDFGTGFSSLTMLHDFPGDTLKIDRTFVDTMMDRPKSHTIIRSIVGLAHDLGLGVVAEGIENGDQLRALRALGCECGQGYHFARPLPSGELAALIAGDELQGVEQPRLPVSTST